MASLDYAAEQTQQALAALGSSTTKETTVWMDGAFDVMHFGHANAFRQGPDAGTRLVVGVNSSSTIEQAKGAPPLLTDEERCAAVKACRFVDDVVPHVPYVMNEAYVRDLLENKGIDYIVHGDDPCIVDGKDVYQAAKDLGRYKTIPRNRGSVYNRLSWQITWTCTSRPSSARRASFHHSPRACGRLVRRKE